MIVHNSSDIQEDSGLSPLLSETVIGRAFRDKVDHKIFFRDYGNETVNLFFVVNRLKFPAKERVRFSKKDNTLYWDVILKYEEVKNVDVKEKKQLLANAIIDSFNVIDKYKELKLNTNKIVDDVSDYFKKLKWI